MSDQCNEDKKQARSQLIYSSYYNLDYYRINECTVYNSAYVALNHQVESTSTSLLRIITIFISPLISAIIAITTTLTIIVTIMGVTVLYCLYS